jgi:hypothetical protein
MNVSPEQIEIICAEVDRNRITLPKLRDDLIDHLCCEVEGKLRAGKPFEECLREALHELAPKGLVRIQEETFSLLNSKKLIHMKKLVYFIGLLSAMCCSFGFLFRILHILGGNQLLTFGFIGFVLLFLPLSAVGYWNANRDKPLIEKLKSITGTASAAVAGLGMAIKVLYIPGADELILCGGLLFTMIFLPIYFFDGYKKSLERST